MAVKHAGGRPPKYKCKEEIEGKIEAYFEECKGELLANDDGTPMMDKFGRPIFINRHPPTVTGLALALGFNSRMSLINYQGKKEFMDTITRAKARIEAYTEERLFDKDGSNGAQFSLKYNFRGWSDRTELDDEEQKARIDQIKANTERVRSKGSDDGEDGVIIVNDAPTGEDIGHSDTEVS